MDHVLEKFQNDSLELLGRRFSTKTVHNDIVYREYVIQWKHIIKKKKKWEEDKGRQRKKV
jgi:DNA/RNA-binding protein KIN17